MTDFVYQGEDFEDKVRKQVEFYFSDSNLQQDKFLWKIYESNDGWVELKTLLTFGRMKQYRPEEKVIEALKSSDKLILSNNNDMIKRKDPLKDLDEVKNTKKKNTVHIEGFPHELSQEEVETWFNEKIIPNLPNEKEICSIRRIKGRIQKNFFGVVDVEFKNEQDAEYLVKDDVQLSYEKGILTKEEAKDLDKKQLLKKMSLLTFQEMRESGKRFGQNEVTKRRNSFNENNKNKKNKGNFQKNKGKKFNKNNNNNNNNDKGKNKDESEGATQTNDDSKLDKVNEEGKVGNEESSKSTEQDQSKKEELTTEVPDLSGQKQDEQAISEE
ncbi:uncharacterized protein KGF55_004479 [Candida pseudojiufengensis]|uniref:uncharacterized protein n=1 Tax=Candida pseudojiufengensis TaxID=497109 RepID=UPI002224C46F|nr:uncharacterized protein KGF55_004479 [Candida pseudojiufengensis]KAI5960586.1 hypothetical protein KGF55_004479 [Candida pseudojiufengensis]